MAEQTLNMVEVQMNEALSLIREDIEDGVYTPTFLLGKFGVGKTAGLKALAKKLNIGYCELRLVNMTETDMLGIPTITTYGQMVVVGPDGKEYTQDKSRTTYASNDLLPMVERDGEVGILAIDEITSCSDVMRAAAYQLLDGQRSLGNYHLPPKWKCVGLGNGPEDGGVFNGGEAALWTRGSCLRIKVTVEDWKTYAIPAGINPAIVAYLSVNPSNIHDYDADEMAGATACPRTWENLSIKLNKREERNGGQPLSLAAVTTYAAMYVGEKIGDDFAGFYKYKASDQMIDPNEVLAGKALGRDILGVDTQVVHITIQSVISLLAKDLSDSHNMLTDDIKKKLVNAAKWAVDIGHQKTDYGVIACKDIMKGLGTQVLSFVQTSNQFRQECPEFLQFCLAKQKAM